MVVEAARRSVRAARDNRPMAYASELVTLLAAGLFSGGAVYVSVAEHPARVQAGTAVALAEFGPSYRRSAPLQGGSALAALIFGVIAAFASGTWLWALAGGCVAVAVPVTLLVIAPLNQRLMSGPERATDAEVSSLLARWAGLHAL